MYATLCDNVPLTTEDSNMKIEIYYYELIEAIQSHVNKRLKSDLNFEDFEGDRLTEVTIVTHHYNKKGKPTTVESHAFGEGDSFSFYFD